MLPPFLKLTPLEQVAQRAEALPSTTGRTLAALPRLHLGALGSALGRGERQADLPAPVDLEDLRLERLTELEVPLEVCAALGPGLARRHQPAPSREEEEHAVGLDPVH